MLTVQGADQLPRLRRCEAGQVHHRVGPQAGDQGPELAILFGRLPVADHHLDVAPHRIVAVGPT